MQRAKTFLTVLNLIVTIIISCAQNTEIYNINGDKFLKEGKYGAAFSSYIIGINNGNTYSLSKIAGLIMDDDIFNEKFTDELKPYRSKLIAYSRTNSDASFLVGTLYYYDEYRTETERLENDKKAFDYILKSANGGCRPGMYRVAYMYYKGIGTNKDISKAVYWWEKSLAKHKDIETYRWLAIAYRYLTPRTTQTMTNSLSYYKLAATTGNTEDSLFYANAILSDELAKNLYKDDLQKQKELNLTAYLICKKVVENENKELVNIGKYYLANMQQNDYYGINKNINESIRLYDEIVESSKNRILGGRQLNFYILANRELANIYYYHPSVPVDYQKAAEHFSNIYIYQKEPMDSTELTRFALSNYYTVHSFWILTGGQNEKLSNDIKKTIELFQELNKRNQLIHFNLLGSLYSMANDYENAITCYKLAFQNPNDKEIKIEVSEKIASIYSADYIHFKKDYEKAFEWYSKAALLGSLNAKFQICKLRDDGFISKEKAKPYCK
jgi:TPR repeat protein